MVLIACLAMLPGAVIAIRAQTAHGPVAPSVPTALHLDAGRPARLTLHEVVNELVTWQYSLDGGLSFRPLARTAALEIPAVQPWMHGVIIEAEGYTASRVKLVIDGTGP